MFGFRLLPALIAGLTALSSLALADSPKCDIDLFKAKQAESTTDVTSLFVLDLVTQDNYDEAKKSASAQYSYYFSGDYNSFDAKRSTSKQESQFNYQHSQSRNYVSSTIDANALTAYSNCLTSGAPLTATLTKSPSAKLITVRVGFRPATAPPNPNPLQIQYLGAKPFGQADAPGGSATFIQDNFDVGERAFLFERLPDQEFVAIVQMTKLGLVADDLSLPAPLKIAKVPEFKGAFATSNASISQPAGAPVGKGWGPQNTCVNADAGWTFVPNSQQISMSAPTSCPTTNLTVSTDATICYAVSLSINAGQSCSASWSVQAKQTRLRDVFQ